MKFDESQARACKKYCYVNWASNGAESGRRSREAFGHLDATPVEREVNAFLWNRMMSGCISDECLCFQFSFSFSAPLSLQPALKDKWWLTRWRTSMPTNVAFVASRLPRPFHFLHPASSHVIPQASNPGATLCRNTATRSPCSTRSSHRVTDRPHARLGHHVYAHDFFADAVHARRRIAQRNARAAGRRRIMCAESRVLHLRAHERPRVPLSNDEGICPF